MAEKDVVVWGILEDDQAVALEIRAGAETPINFGVLTGRAYRVNGSVTGVPSTGNMAQIMLQSNGSGRSDMAPQELGEGGKFEFLNVLPGSYVASLMTVTFEGGRPGMQVLRLDPAIEVSNSHLEGLQLQPEASGQVRMKFRLDTGQKFDWTQMTVTLLPVEGFGVGLVQEGAFGLPISSSVNIDGTFELKNVAGGNYQVLVGAKSNNLADYITKSVNLESQDVPIQVSRFLHRRTWIL